MTDIGFIAGCALIFGLVNATSIYLSVSILPYNQIEQLIKLWHREKHKSADYYTKIQRDQDSGQVRGDDAGDGSGEDS